MSTNDGDPLVDDLFYYSQYRRVECSSRYRPALPSNGLARGARPERVLQHIVLSLGLFRREGIRRRSTRPVRPVGLERGRAPSLAFDGASHLAANRDVAARMSIRSRISGKRRPGRPPAAFAVSELIAPNGFDYAYYLQHNPDVAAAVSIRSGISRRQDGRRAATRMPCSTPVDISRPIPTSQQQGSIRSTTIIRMAGSRGATPRRASTPRNTSVTIRTWRPRTSTRSCISCRPAITKAARRSRTGCGGKGGPQFRSRRPWTS